MHSVRSRGRRHRKRRLVRELGGSRQGNRHPWWFSPDDRDWLCSPDRSRRCVSLHMLVTAAEFLLGPSLDVSDKIERPFILIGRSLWVIRWPQLPKAIGNRDLSRVLFKLPIRPRLSLRTFVGNVSLGFPPPPPGARA